MEKYGHKDCAASISASGPGIGRNQPALCDPQSGRKPQQVLKTDENILINELLSVGKFDKDRLQDLCYSNQKPREVHLSNARNQIQRPVTYEVNILDQAMAAHPNEGEMRIQLKDTSTQVTSREAPKPTKDIGGHSHAPSQATPSEDSRGGKGEVVSQSGPQNASQGEQSSSRRQKSWRNPQWGHQLNDPLNDDLDSRCLEGDSVVYLNTNMEQFENQMARG